VRERALRKNKFELDILVIFCAISDALCYIHILLQVFIARDHFFYVDQSRMYNTFRSNQRYMKCGINMKKIVKNLRMCLEECIFMVMSIMYNVRLFLMNVYYKVLAICK